MAGGKGLAWINGFNLGWWGVIYLSWLHRSRWLSMPLPISSRSLIFKDDQQMRGYDPLCLRRYWPSAGPQEAQYIPGPLLKLGKNELILLETEVSPCRHNRCVLL